MSAAATNAHAEPQRVVSFNLCADQLVLALADPGQIAGLSPYATDPDLSVVAAQAEKFHRLEWQAESVVPLEPDLVLVSQGDRAVTRAMLMQLNFNVHEIGLVSDIGSAKRQVREVAQLLGHPERGEKLIADIDAARARLDAAPHPQNATALLVGHGGYTAGPASLAAAIVNAAGLHPPPGAPAGYGGFVPLEQLVMLRPDYLVVTNSDETPSDQGGAFLSHPAMRFLFPRFKRIVLPNRYTLCGGPALVAALDYLTGVVTRLSAREH